MIRNQHGWGLREMIILSAILLSFLLVAIFFIVRLYNGLTKDGTINTPIVKKYTYSEIESNVLTAALDYYNEYYDGESNVTITTDRLKKRGFITTNELKPESENKSCRGYVFFGDNEPSVYIQCESYETDGYEE